MLRDLSALDPGAVVASLEVDLETGRITCPICGRRCGTQEANVEGSGFWGHFFSARHASHRPAGFDAELGTLLRPVIASTARRVRRARLRLRRAEEAAAAAAKAASAEAEARRLAASYPVSGELLDEITAEMTHLIGMMEPYYAQGDADADARALIARIEAISRPAEEET